MVVNVGVVGPQKVDDFAENICHSLAAMGVNYTPLGPAVPTVRGRLSAHGLDLVRQASSAVTDRLQRDLIRSAGEVGCDIVISVDSRLSQRSVRALQQQGAKVGLWFPDHVISMGKLDALSAGYDRLYFKDQLLVSRMTAVYGFPARFMPEACNPAWHTPTGSAGSRAAVAVVGNLYPSRLQLLDRLIDAGIPLDLYGGVPPRGVSGFKSAGVSVRPFVGRHDKARVFHEARVVLNNLHPGEMSSLNCRLFEATGSGGVVVCEDRDSLGDLFERDREVLAFRTFDQLVGHIRSALDQPETYADLREAASKRAHRDHSYEVRLTRILEDLA